MNNEINAMFEELLLREAAIKESQKRVDEIKRWCKEQGSFSTDRYLCSIATRTRTCLVGLDRVAEAIGWEVIEKEELVRTSEYQVVQITEIESTLRRGDEMENSNDRF